LKINCKVYSKEMQLLGLRRQLDDPRLDKREKERLLEEISRLEKILGLYEPGKTRQQER